MSLHVLGLGLNLTQVLCVPALLLDVWCGWYVSRPERKT